MHLLFNNSFGLQLTPDQVIREIVTFVNLDRNRPYKIIIGTDSQRLADKTADFVTAIVVHRVGNGGQYFWRRIQNGQKYHTLRQRITQEVLTSLDIAKTILEKLKTAELPEFDFEIHVDIGNQGETKVMIQELVSMVRANNFEVKTKPDSYAASKVADRHT